MIPHKDRLHVIAQDDDNDYEESGYIVFRHGRRYYIEHYSHCSCYGTLDALDLPYEYHDGTYIAAFDPEREWLWAGTAQELITLAQSGNDPAAPDISVSEPQKNYDYGHLLEVYRQVLDHFGKPHGPRIRR